MTIKHDWGTHYLGWAFYQKEGWHFPIGDIHNYFYPVGTNVGFTDSIPLLSIFFKLFSFAIPNDFQYFGIWLFACHLLAAYYTILLCRLFKLNDVMTFIAVIFIAANPVLIYRGLHPALCAHWLLLAFIYVYFLDKDAVKPAKILRYQFVLLMIAALVNPYICFMVLGFSIATAIKHCFYGKTISKKYFLSYLGISFLSLVLLMYITGIMSFSSKEDVGVEGGYGLYGLNLHSLYNSFGFSEFFKGLRQVRPHQYEGYMYLGAGMFFLLFVLLIYAIILFIKRRQENNSFHLKFSLIKNRSFPLYVLFGLFTLFAISHVVTINDKTLFTVPLPKIFIKLGDIFRASARIFWPVYYIIIFFTIVNIAKSKMKALLKTGILIFALLLQLYDTQLIFTYRKLTHGTYKPPIDIKSWQTLIGRFDEVVMYPPFETSNLENMDYQYFCYLASKEAKPITTGYVARVDNRAVKAYKDSLAGMLEEGRLSPSSLYIVTPNNLQQFSLSLQSDSARLNYLDGYYYIFSARKKDSVVAGLSEQLNKNYAGKIDSAVKALGQRVQFEKLNDLSLVKEGKIHFNLERFKERDAFIVVAGWGYKEGNLNSKSDSVFFVLKNEKNIYTAPVIVQQRPDVTAHFKAEFLDNTGFNAVLFNDKVEKGIYTLAIAVKDQQGALTYTSTGKTIKVHFSEYATLKKVDNWPEQNDDISFNAETITKDEKAITIQGWAFLKDQDASQSRIAIVLKKEADLYYSFTEPMSRPDVTAHFKNGFKLDNSGFTIKISKGALPPGNYQLGIYVQDTLRQKESMRFTGKEIEF